MSTPYPTDNLTPTDRLTMPDNILDILGIDRAEVKRIEACHAGPSLYKYMPPAREHFFAKPQFRFTQKDALNDPFEMSRRWAEIASAQTRNGLQQMLVNALSTALQNDDFLLKKIVEKMRDRGISINVFQKIAIREKMRASEFAEIRDAIKAQMIGEIPTLIGGIFSEDNHKYLVDKISAEIGIFSTSDDVDNHQLWALYAESGAGFQIGINTGHPFFGDKDGNSSFRKVIYSDQNIAALMNNIYYLFLAKNKNWDFEREWRMLRVLDTCDHIIDSSVDPRIYLCNATPGMIQSITFGYAYKGNKQMNIDLLMKFDDAISFYEKKVDPENRKLETIPMK